ncbi:dehydratase [Cryobacterium sp. Hh7]|uniref:MaoC family dehydratase n=1 Tax=Cryobacterium sp. Hh7 TaxID=1259159 RepID=UPI0010693A4D|nr:MaoC/PaaZ C-terminal domain-containing protein [Cryobacterium sp. Hh7]TFD50727.1 dehydratase [Cryobacterium sp. Hh7]
MTVDVVLNPISINDEAIHQLVGQQWSFSRTIGEYDVLSFGGVTGDLAANHTDEQYMRANGFDGRIAHGVLLLGYTSALSTRVADLVAEPVVSLGYDRVRFTAPVTIGTTVTVQYTVIEVDRLKRRIYSETRIDVAREHQTGEGVTALFATHIMKAV